MPDAIFPYDYNVSPHWPRPHDLQQYAEDEPMDLFHNQFHDLVIQHLVNIRFDLLWWIVIQSCHSFAHGTTAQLSWHVGNCDTDWNTQIRAIGMLTPYRLWAHKLFMKCITMTSKWVPWRLKSPASRLFTQPFVQAQIIENSKAPRHWPLWGESTDGRWIPRTK